MLAIHPLKILIILLLLYIVGQIVYSGYYFFKARSLLGIKHNQNFESSDKSKPDFRMYINGDSVATGVGATSFETTFPGLLSQYLSQKYHVVLKNDSKAGNKMADLAASFPQEKQNLIVVIIASNDLLRFSPFGEFTRSTQTVLDKYSELSEKVIIIGPGGVHRAPVMPIFMRPIYNWRAKKYISIIDGVAKKHPNITYLNSTNIPHNFRPNPNQARSVDSFHPGDEGHRLFFELIKSTFNL